MLFVSLINNTCTSSFHTCTSFIQLLFFIHVLFFSMGGEGVRIKREGGKEEKGGGELKEKGGEELKEEERQEKG